MDYIWSNTLRRAENASQSRDGRQSLSKRKVRVPEEAEVTSDEEFKMPKLSKRGVPQIARLSGITT
jgi:hypothetical protein